MSQKTETGLKKGATQGGKPAKRHPIQRPSLKTTLQTMDWKAFWIMEGKALFWDVIGSFIYAVGIYTFAKEAEFAPGGVTGMSLILNYLFPRFNLGTLTFLINVPIVLVSFHYLGLGYLLRTLQTIIFNSIFLDFVAPLVPTYRGNPLLAAICAGALSGIGLAILYQAGTCTGGSDLVIMSVRKVRPHMSIGQITMFTDGSLILVGAFIYQKIDAMIYGIIFTVISTIVIDKMMAGRIAGKTIMVISSKYETINREIADKIQRGTTLFNAEGGYTGNPMKVVLCACSKNQLPRIQTLVHEIDPNALMIVTDYSEVRGQGFLAPEV